MRKSTLLAAAALAAVAFGTSSVSAQDTTRKESKGEVMMKPVTVSTLVTVIDASLANAGKVSAIKPETPPTLEIVDIKPIIANEADEKIVKEAIEKNKDSIKQLEDVLKQNTTLKSALDNHPLKPDDGDVVGVDVQEGNKVVVYFWKR